MPNVAQGPTFQIAVVRCYGNVRKNSKDANVLPNGTFGIQFVQDKGRAVVAKASAKSAGGPLNP